MKIVNIIVKGLIFSQKKAFLIFRDMKTPNNFLIFRETSYISGSNFLISKNFKKRTLKKLFIFHEMKFFRYKLKKLLIFQEGN